MKKIFYGAFMALLAVGCTRHDESDTIVRPTIDAPEKLYAEFEAPESRTYVENETALRWTGGDEISYFPGVPSNLQYRYEGVTGTNNASFTKITTNPVTGTALSRNYAVYPYAATTTISDDEIISLVLPAVQRYAENSFGVGANTMVCATEDINDNVLRFKNVGGYLKIKLYGEDVTVQSITLQGNKNEKIAGAATLTAAYDKNPQLTMTDDATETVTIDCGEGVALSAKAEEPTAFWFVLPEVTFAEGFTITVTDINGDKFEQSTSNSFTIDRNMIQPMKTLKAVIESADSDATKPASNEIWYTNGSTTEATAPNATDVFGATITSNEYDEEKECWVITFDGEVTSIGDDTFRGCRDLTSVTIPDSATSIGDRVFMECTGLTSVTIPNSVTSIGKEAFHWCERLQSVTIPDSVTSIGYSAFYWCTGLTSMTIPDSVTSIGDAAFSYCIGLTSFYGKFASADNRCLIVDSRLMAFAPADCDSYTIPDSVTSIGREAFYQCTGLTSITIGNSVTSIGDHAFNECTGLTSITIPDSVTSIGEFAFAWCTGLTSVTIPDSVESIGNNAFRECTGLTSFYGKFASSDHRCLIVNGHLIAFAPADCNSYTIPDSVTNIGEFTFYKCSGLTSVTIPNSVTRIGEFAFSGCTGLTSVYCKPTTPPTGGLSMFNSNASGRKIYVPASDDDSIIKAYQSAQRWSDYASDIEEYDFSAAK